MSEFFAASIIARAVGWHPRTVARHASKWQWPARRIGNRLEYVPPDSMLEKSRAHAATLRANLGGLTITDQARTEARKSNEKFNALCEYERLVLRGFPIEKVLRSVAIQFHTSPSQIRVWAKTYLKSGLAGLADRRPGRSGRSGRKPKGAPRRG